MKPASVLAPEGRSPARRPRLFLVPMGAGANEPRLREGPEAIVAALGPTAAADAAIEAVVPPVGPAPELADLDDPDGYARMHHLVDARALADALAPRVAASLARRELPIVLGGDHTVAIGSYAGARLAVGPEQRLGILWVDAHPDLNTPATTPSNHGHGMPLAALLGLGHSALVNAGGIVGAKLSTAEVALVGIRSIDEGEARLLASHPEMVAVPAAVIHQKGFLQAIEPVLEWVGGLDGLHLSFDLDAIDPAEAPGVTTPVEGGLSAEEGLALVRAVGQAGRLVSADVVEHLPARDRGGRTASLAATLIRELASIG